MISLETNKFVINLTVDILFFLFFFFFYLISNSLSFFFFSSYFRTYYILPLLFYIFFFVFTTPLQDQCVQSFFLINLEQMQPLKTIGVRTYIVKYGKRGKKIMLAQCSLASFNFIISYIAVFLLSHNSTLLFVKKNRTLLLFLLEKII